jgi:hypothetical protein
MLDVVMYAYEHPEGVRRADVAQALDLDPRQASVYLSRAADAGRLRRAERGLYTPVMSVALLSPQVPEPSERNSPVSLLSPDPPADLET